MKISIKNNLLSRFLFIVLSLTLLLTLSGGQAACADDISVSAQLNSETFPVDEAVLLTIKIQGANSAAPPVPAGKGLQFTYRGQNSQMQWINGKTSSTISFSYMMQASQPGNYKIEPVRVSVQGKEYVSNPLDCTVVPAASSKGTTSPTVRQGTQSGQSGPAARLRSGDADKIGFMRITPKHEILYSGQLTHITVKAYFRRGLRVTINTNPHLLGNNFILHSLDEKPVQKEELVNGEPYVALTWQGTLSAVKEGSLPLEFELDATLLVRENRQQRNDPFGSLLGRDPFFDDFFARYSRREVKLVSPKKTITVRDLPTQGRPDDFNGAIGSYSLAVAAAPVKGKIGDPITLKMMVSGTGNFDLVHPPVLTDTNGWKTYPPEETYEEEKPGQGKKRFEQAIVPTSEKLTAIGPVQFSYFDPELKEYVSLNSDAIAIELEQTAASAVTLSDQKQAENQDATDLSPASNDNFAPLRTDLGNVVTTIKPLYQKSWFIVLTALACLLLIVALLLYLRSKRLADNPQILLQKNLTKTIGNHLQKMQEALEASDQGSFINHCRLAIQEHLAMQWGLGAQAITLADLEQRLDEQAPLRKIFSQLEQAGFSGHQLSRKAMTTIMHDTKKELNAS